MPAIRSNHNSTSHSTRTRSSVACRNCRQRKIKCDIQDLENSQSCTKCVQSCLECVIDRNGDRRKLTSRKQIETLQQRIRELEALVEHTKSVVTTDISSQNAYAVGNGHTNIAPNITLNELDQSSARNTQKHGIIKDSTRHEDGAGDGEAVFGLTSPAHVWLSEEKTPENSFDCSDDFSEDLQFPGVRVDMHSAQLKSHLLQIYFKYQRLWINVVHKGVFMEHRVKNVASQWYSKFLETVLLACASRISTSSAVRALGNEYAKEAKAGIIEALEHPSAASLQGFILLSEYEVTIGHDRMGWMLSGMACRMIFDLGLHRKMEPPNSTMDENSTPTEANLYFSLLCAMISYEGIWCMYLGRPSSIQKSIIDATSKQCKSSKSQQSRMAVAWVGLCDLMAQINDIINDSCLSMESAPIRLRQLEEELQHWQDSLPIGLRYSDSDIEALESEAYGLQMQYCKIQIFLHQAPILSSGKRKFGQSDFEDPQDQNSLKGMPEFVYKYALQAAKLLLRYRQLFGTDKISSIMLDNANLAATTLIHHLLTQSIPYGAEVNAKQWLRSIYCTLDEVQTHFPITKRMMQSLKKMVLNTPLSGIFTASSSSSPLSSIEKFSPSTMSQRNTDTYTNISSSASPPFILRPDQLVNDQESQVRCEQPVRDWHSDEQTINLIDSQQTWFEDENSDFAASVMSWPNSQYLSNLVMDTING